MHELKCLNCLLEYDPKELGDYISWECPKCGWTNQEGEFPPGDIPDPITYKKQFFEDNTCIVSYPPISKSDLEHLPEKLKEGLLVFFQNGGAALTAEQRDNVRHNLYSKDYLFYLRKSKKTAAKAKLIRFLQKTDVSTLFPGKGFKK